MPGGWPDMDAKSAKCWALERLQLGEVIDHPQAIIAGRGWRLAARIHELRQEGHNILTARGRGGVGRYYMDDGRQGDLFAGRDPAATGSGDNGETTKAGGGHGK